MKVVRKVDIGHRARMLSEQALVGRPGAGALHALQHPVGGVLQRQVDVAAHLPAVGDGVDGGVGDGGRVEIEQPHPLDAVHAVEGADQPGQAIALLAVEPVEGGVLRDQQQFLDAASSQGLRLRPPPTRRSGCDSGRASWGSRRTRTCSRSLRRPSRRRSAPGWPAGVGWSRRRGRWGGPRQRRARLGTGGCERLRLASAASGSRCPAAGVVASLDAFGSRR